MNARATVAVVQFPGVNCEAETVRALERAGLAAEVFRWTRPAAELRVFQAFVLPGGFSHQDRVRAGAIAAKDPMVQVLAEEAGRGRPVLGICNGAQVLVEAGLVPGSGTVDLALARNRMPERTGYHARWVMVRIQASPCVFTGGFEPGELLPLPVAHGEGRFTGRPGRIADLVRNACTPLRYASAGGAIAEAFPDNPNGSEEAVAAVCNARGNVLAMMPHPERALDLGAIARGLPGTWAARARGGPDGGPVALAEAGPGLGFFTALARHLEEA